MMRYSNPTITGKIFILTTKAFGKWKEVIGKL